MVFNSAKNKYDNEEDVKDDNKVNVIEDINSSNGSDSGDTGLSTARYSGDSNNSNNTNTQNYLKTPFASFLGENKKPDEKKIYKNGDNDDLLNLQIKYALRNISEEYSAYSSNSITSPLCDYYLSGINININKNITNSENKNKNSRLSNYNYYNKFNVRK